MTTPAARAHEYTQIRAAICSSRGLPPSQACHEPEPGFTVIDTHQLMELQRKAAAWDALQAWAQSK